MLQPKGVNVTVNPPQFTINPGGNQNLEITLTVMLVLDDFSFGEIVLTGSLNHIVRMPLSVFPVAL